MSGWDDLDKQFRKGKGRIDLFFLFACVCVVVAYVCAMIIVSHS